MEAYLYHPLENGKVECRLCGHRCIIKPGRRGICGVRENRSGVLETLVFGKLIARNVDPIEKKPMFHLMPGSLSYSIATVGCNFKCRFCQNADIAQMPSDRKGLIMGDAASPREIVDDAVRRNCASIAYTYTEPTVFFEFALETAKLAHQKGIANVFVTNGYMTSEALEMASPYLTAANLDLKAFTDDYYKTYCSARIEPVKNTLRTMKRLGILVEITTLIIPGLNDASNELAALAAFIADELGTQTPWHVSRFHPTYRLMDRPSTPVETLLRARQIGLSAGLKYVYTGNIPGHGGEDTRCYQCGETLIERWGFQVGSNRATGGKCRFCGAEIHGLGL